jgi:3-oxoacyl-[acyl-carrier protein] reductase
MTRKALVTGGSRGIGKAIAERLRAAGMEVHAPGRSELDLSDPASIAGFLSGSHDFDVLVNCAGENLPKQISDVTDAHLNQTLQVNFISAFQLLRSIAEGMASRGWGRIVNVSSIYSGLARPGRAPYSASKSALDALTRSAALEFGPRGVLVNSVCPGFVDTELTRRNNSPEVLASLASATALQRLARPEEIARLVEFLAGEHNTYLTGQSLVVDGGFSIQ